MWTPRTSNIKFDFGEGKEIYRYIYADAKNAHYKTNPQAYVIRKVVVTNKSKLSQLSAPGGGYAVSIIRKKSNRGQQDSLFYFRTIVS
jgi:hypothetical protein